MISQDSKKGLRNPWFLGMLGSIVVVLAVNATFIWFATTQKRSALVEREYSTRDRKSGAAEVSDIQSRNMLAWKTVIKQPKIIVTNYPATYEINVVDREGVPVSGTMEVVAYRAADENKDFTTIFKEVSTGNYQGAINFPLKGYWELRIRVKRGDDVFEVGTDRFPVTAAS